MKFTNGCAQTVYRRLYANADSLIYLPGYRTELFATATNSTVHKFFVRSLYCLELIK